MIHFTGVTSKIAGQTTVFAEKGLVEMTVGRLGDSGTSVPNEQQLAYDVYRANIEAFIAATARKEKLPCNSPAYPFPTEYVRALPLPVPSTVIKF